MKRLTKTITAILLFTVALKATAQNAITPAEYVELYKDLAIQEMKRMGVPAAITLAQGLLETDNGNSVLVKKSNNHFGIKCKSTWTAATVTHDDDAKGECFRAYNNAEDSYRDHSNFLRGNQRYGFLFSLDIKDYEGWAYGLKKAGYATNPQYPKILIKHIEQYNLQQYTLMAADETPVSTTPVFEEVTQREYTRSNISVMQTQADAGDKVITINGSKCVYAARGTSMLVIATKNNVPLVKLLNFNEFAEDGLIGENQYVYLERKSKIGEKDFYIAKSGESLYDIAQVNGMQLEFMLTYNKLWGNEDVAEGMKIYLKPDLVQQQKKITVSAEPQTEKQLHIVQPKEGLYSIARKYNVTVKQLKEWNKLEVESLKIGQELIVSQ